MLSLDENKDSFGDDVVGAGHEATSNPVHPRRHAEDCEQRTARRPHALLHFRERKRLPRRSAASGQCPTLDASPRGGAGRGTQALDSAAAVFRTSSPR